MWGYTIDKHLDEFEDMTRLPKDARILDLAAGTGIVGEIVRALFCSASSGVKLIVDCNPSF